MANNTSITPPRVPMVDSNGYVTREWFRYLFNQYTETAAGNFPGGSAGSLLYQKQPSVTTTLSVGTVGQVLKVNAAQDAPEWVSGAPLSTGSDVNVILTAGGSYATSLLAAASLTVAWSGVLSVGRGGTGLGSYATNGVMYAPAAGSLSTSGRLQHDGNTVGIGQPPSAAAQIQTRWDTTGSLIISTTYGATSAIAMRAGGGSIASPAVTPPNYRIMGLVAGATYDGINFVNCASIDANVTGTPTSISTPSTISFSVTAPGSTTRAVKFKIWEEGNVTVATDATINPAMNSGFIYIPTGSGAPTGVPNLYLGTAAPLYYDSLNSCIFVYDGGGWKASNLYKKTLNSVTQLTDKSTSVTLNEQWGQIVTSSSALGAGATVVFELNNYAIIANRTTCTVNLATNNPNYTVFVKYVGGASVGIGVTNTSGASLSDALTLTFMLQTVPT